MDPEAKLLNEAPFDVDDDDDTREMDMYEFIRTVDRDSRHVKKLVDSERSSQDSQSSGASSTKPICFSKKASSTDPVRKLSDTASLSDTAQRIMKPSLRMKAFKGRRQQTFHSLEAYVVHDSPETVPDETSSASEDVLKMPAIEALRVSSPATVAKPVANIKKTYHKINSDPAMVLHRTKSSNPPREGTPKNGTPVKRVLHTVEQPDGSVMGYCTELPLEDAKNVKKPATK